MAVSSAVFPSLDAHKSDVSVISRHATAMEVCELVYGNAGLTPWDTIERFYESSAGTHVPFLCQRAVSTAHPLASADLARRVRLQCELHTYI